MNIIENPLQSLIYTLLFLIFLLCFFKVVEFLGKTSKKSKDEKKEEPSKKDEKKETVENLSTPFSDSNYLYDRFVINPTIEDNIKTKSNNAFLEEDDYKKIKDRKIEIKVRDVEDLEVKNNALHSKIQQMTKLFIKALQLHPA